MNLTQPNSTTYTTFLTFSSLRRYWSAFYSKCQIGVYLQYYSDHYFSIMGNQSYSNWMFLNFKTLWLWLSTIFHRHNWSPNFIQLCSIFIVSLCTLGKSEVSWLIHVKHEYLRSRASTCLSLSLTSPVISQLGKIMAIEILDTRAYIFDLASKNFLLDFVLQTE